MEPHARIRELISNAGSRYVSVRFLKQDGSVRQLTFNPLHFGEVKGTGSDISDPEKRKNIFRVMDSKIRITDTDKGWRSFDARTVISMTVNGKTINLAE
jgi:hypothetical protein